MYAEPATWLRPSRQLTAYGGDALSHTDKPVTRTELPARCGSAGVGYVDCEGVGGAGEADSGGRAGRVFQHVGEGLLDDAVGGEFYDVREVADGVGRDPVDFDTCCGERVDQGAQFVQGRCRCGR